MADDFDDLEISLEAPEPPDLPWEPTVVFGEGVWEAIQAHAAEDVSSETGGVLLGRSAAGETGPVVVVEAAVRALHTDASRGSVTFTHDTWAAISDARDRDHPDLQIVGWYHTHPGFGLFLSDYDLFIQRNFFADPSQVALVVDPREGTSGFFAWKGEELLGPFESTRQTAAPLAHPELTAVGARPVHEDPAPPKGRGAVIGPWILAASLGLILVLQLFLLSMVRPVAPGSETKADLSALAGKVTSLQKQIASLEETVKHSRQVPAPDAMQTYKVTPGDSLWGIAEEIYGDGAKWGALSVYNGVEPDDLEPGMILRVPPVAQPTGAEPDGR